MKKYLKLQAKKSMSLFLAVLMLLSCWVWVAPDKAEAGVSKPGSKYKLSVYYTITGVGYKSGHIQYKTSADNGWGAENNGGSYYNLRQSFSSGNNDDAGNNVGAAGSHVVSIELDAFPTAVSIRGAERSSCNDTRLELTKVEVNGKPVFEGAFGFNNAGADDDHTATIWTNKTADGAGSSNGSGDFTWHWAPPMLTGFYNETATASEVNVAVEKDKNVTKAASYDINSYECYDQYGVKISNPNSFVSAGRMHSVQSTETFIATTRGSDEAVTEGISAEGGASDNFTVTPAIQTLNPQASTGTASYYLVRKYTLDDGFGGTHESKATAKINLTYPTHTIKFDGGLSTAKITADKEYTGSYSPSGFHGANITLPSKTVADGYTFYEYWSKPQPATGNASYNASEALFAQPCSTEDYASYKADGGKEEDGILTDKDGGKWYDAGVKLDPSTAKQINVSGNIDTPDDKSDDLVTTWYAWWLSKDLSVKFYDVDGTFLGEYNVKSGQTQSAIEKWPTSKYSTYTSGAFTFTVAAGVWENTDGSEIEAEKYTFTKDLILTPKLTRTGFTDKYTVTFANPKGGNYSSAEYAYRADNATVANNAKDAIKAESYIPTEFGSDLEFRYELLGWSSVAPTTDKNYHVLLEDADFDKNGTAIGLNSDWVVRGNATYYAVYRRYTKTYVVNYTFKDATGAPTTRQLKVKYGEKIAPDTAYVPYTYVTKGYGYTFANWIYDGTKTFDYSDNITLNTENVNFGDKALDDGVDVEPIQITATYGDGVPTKYTITFSYIDADGKEAVKTVYIDHEQFFTNDLENTLTSAENWENEDKLYTFANKWEIIDGAAAYGTEENATKVGVGAYINTADLSDLTPTSNITFKAVYANPVNYYTVTYVDASNTITYRDLAGANVPEWTVKVNNDNGTPDDPSDDVVEDKVYTPVDYEGNGGKYVFQGWYDEKQTDTTFASTNGNKLTNESKLERNITYYSQFKFVPDTFTIKFIGRDGTQLGYGEFEKGANIEYVSSVATKAANSYSDPDDNKYEYVFLGWDKAVPTFCEGYDVTYTALYKAVYKYYNVKWYNSKLVDGNWVADKSTATNDEGKEVETNLLATTRHTFESKLNTPAVKNLTSLTAAPDGQTYVFAGWYTTVDGEAVKYERGMLVTGDMEFYATYTLTDKVYKVTTDVKGETTTYDVADGEKAIIPDPQAGYLDETYHDKFAGWYTDAAFTTSFDANDVITADTKIYAKFDKSEHEFTKKEDKTAPTYYATGVMNTWCECDASKIVEETIPVLQDSTAPTGIIYLGTHSWSSTDEVGAAATDNNPISIFVNGKTDVIITANDDGIGVKTIKAFAFPAGTVLTAKNYGAATSIATTVYEDTTQDLTNIANFSIKLSDVFVADLDENGDPQYDEGNVKFKDLEDGEDYILYYFVYDKATAANSATTAAGNLLNRFVRTAKFTYDNTAPTFTVTGDSNNATIPTYCGSATVTGLEKDVVLTINGEPVDVVYAEGEETGTYIINYAKGNENVLIKATDKAGNTFTKKIKLADHSILDEYVASTCTASGYHKESCIICGYVQAEETYDAVDHVMTDRTVFEADCVNNGYVVVKCENCDYSVKTEFDENNEAIIPALGHEYAKDDNNEIIYTTVTASTCKTNGAAEAICTVCGEGKLEKALDLDPENHEDLTITELAPTCTEHGYYSKTCICSDEPLVYYNEVTHADIYAAKGHGDTFEEVIAEPTCYQAGTKAYKCSVCTEIIDTTEIAATGEHIKTVANPDTYKTERVVRYKCATEGCTHAYADKVLPAEVILKEYTIKFVAEDGTEIKTMSNVVEGTAITKDDVTAPEKAKDEVYSYTFAGWVADGKTYKLPFTPTKDMILKASYKATKRTYTHQFLDANGNEFTTLVGTYGTERVPAQKPVKENDALKTYEFLGWKNAKGVQVTDFTVVTDATFEPIFGDTANFYEVIFYNGNDLAGNATVEAGTAVDTSVVADPEKAPDSEGHYEFNGWYTDPACTTKYNADTMTITTKTRLYAGYTTILHEYESEVTQEANCTVAEETTYTCEVCGYYYTAITLEAPGHDVNYDKLVQIKEGVYGYKCSVETCDYYEEEGVNTFKVKFFNDSKNALVTITVVSGDKLVLKDEEMAKLEDLTKASTVDKHFAFANKWNDGTKDYTIEEILALDIDKAYNFTAVYDETERLYTVTYLDANFGVIETKQVAYGSTLYECSKEIAEYITGTNEHKVFVKWDKAAGVYEITGDTEVLPVYKTEKHAYKPTETTVAPTCTEPGKVVETCACGAEKEYGTTVPALGHTNLDANGNEVEDVHADSTYDDKGYDGYYCTRCGELYKVKEYPLIPSATITVVVLDANDEPAVGAAVTLTNKNDPTEVYYGSTDPSGKTTFGKVDAGKDWLIGVTGEGLPGGYGGELTNAKGEVTYTAQTEAKEEDDSCSCSCHKKSFWGIIFRLFQKFIAIFKGEISCCADPSELYNK